MSRSERLFQLLEALRTLSPPVTGQALALETGVSVRSIYRDIESLRAGGAEIAGEPGSGYTLVDDGSLRPRTFSRIEIEALTLGLANVRQMGDPALAAAADAVLGKVAGTLPSLGQQHMLHAVSRVHQFAESNPVARLVKVDMDLIRQACWREQALDLRYIDRNGMNSERRIWPLAIVYVERMLVLLAFCCLREDFRIFRVERMTSIALTGASFRPKRVALLRTYLGRLHDGNEAPY